MSFEGTNVVYSTPEVPETTELELTPDDLDSIKLFVTFIREPDNYTAISLECFYNASTEAPRLFEAAIASIVAASEYRCGTVDHPQDIVKAALALQAVRRRAFHSNLFPDGCLISRELVEKIVKMYFAQLKASL